MIGQIPASQRLICVACHAPVDLNRVETRGEIASRMADNPEPVEKESVIVQP
jgi:hypothetical protein